MPAFAKSLFGQVVFALLLGVCTGLFAPEFAVQLKPLGDGFINLIRMIIPILVFCVVCTASPVPATSSAWVGAGSRR